MRQWTIPPHHENEAKLLLLTIMTTITVVIGEIVHVTRIIGETIEHGIDDRLTAVAIGHNDGTLPAGRADDQRAGAT